MSAALPVHFHPTSQHPCVVVPVWRVASLQRVLTEQFVLSNTSTITQQMYVHVQKVSMLTATACSARQKTEPLCCVWPPCSSKTLHVLGGLEEAGGTHLSVRDKVQRGTKCEVKEEKN